MADDDGLNKKRKRDNKDSAKMSFKLVYTNDQGQSKPLTGQEFEEFKLKFPEVAQLILEADSRVDEEMINKVKDIECW